MKSVKGFKVKSKEPIVIWSNCMNYKREHSGVKVYIEDHPELQIGLHFEELEGYKSYVFTELTTGMRILSGNDSDDYLLELSKVVDKILVVIDYPCNKDQVEKLKGLPNKEEFEKSNLEKLKENIKL